MGEQQKSTMKQVKTGKSLSNYVNNTADLGERSYPIGEMGSMGILIFILLLLCMCVSVVVHVEVTGGGHQESLLSFHHVNSRNRTQVAKLNSQCLHLLSRLTSPRMVVLKKKSHRTSPFVMMLLVTWPASFGSTGQTGGNHI